MIQKHKIRAGMLMVQPSEKVDKVTKGGIIIPDTAVGEPLNGKLVIVGTPLLADPHDLKKGDLVFYGERAGQEITLYGQKYKLMQSKEVLTYIPKEDIETLN